MDSSARTAGELEHEREREGLEMILAGLRDGLAWMPRDCPTWRSFGVLLAPAEHRLALLRASEQLPSLPHPDA
jgi:hypothetical protein